VDNLAHVGGFAAGILIALVLYRRPEQIDARKKRCRAGAIPYRGSELMAMKPRSKDVFWMRIPPVAGRQEHRLGHLRFYHPENFPHFFRRQNVFLPHFQRAVVWFIP